MLTLKAPAKINLFLEIVGKRKDGYHNLNTLFLKIKLYDQLRFQKTDKIIKINSNHKDICLDKRNLIYKAAVLMQKTTKKKFGVDIYLDKKIPIGAGLGGGSSDAAATLIALNKLWELKLPQKKLHEIGKKIGSDVPFFLLKENAAIGQGRGDILKPLNFKKKYWIVLVKPKIFISTKEIYQRLAPDLTKRRNDVKLLIRAWKNSDLETVGKTLFNRLETVTLKHYKQIAKVKKIISALGVRAVLMSGSGSVIFGIVQNREEAIRIKRKLQNRHEVMAISSL
ncbi:MAG: 4-(cytidine 5'-diphospho)-2-C-methyl-D-erythritol kinase [Candidatus Omnitrophota bacterium]